MIETYDDLKRDHLCYFDPEYLHEYIVAYAKRVAKKKKVPVWSVVSEIISSGSTVASIITERHE